MKKFLILVISVVCTMAARAQSEKYVKAMESLVPAVDTTRSESGLLNLSNAFERIANVEKTQWLPFYYAALCKVNIANGYFQAQQLDKIDPLMDQVEPLLNAADKLQKDNSEIALLKKMFNTARMMADPMNRYMTYGGQATTALELAKSLDPGNPRVYLMEGIDRYFTPEQFGGSKEEGRKLFEKADKLFESFKPASSIHPSWGRPTVKYFLAESAK